MIIITGCGDLSVANTGLCTLVLLTGCQLAKKAVFQITNTRGYLILHRETVRKIGYIHFPKIMPLKLTLQPKMHAHLKATKVKTSRQEAASVKDWGLRHLRVQLLDGVVLINGKKHRLPIMKEDILKEYSDVFSGVETLPGKEYHIILKKNYVPVQGLLRSVLVKIK